MANSKLTAFVYFVFKNGSNVEKQGPILCYIYGNQKIEFQDFCRFSRIHFHRLFKGGISLEYAEFLSDSTL